MIMDTQDELASRLSAEGYVVCSVCRKGQDRGTACLADGNAQERLVRREVRGECDWCGVDRMGEVLKEDAL